MKQLDLFPKDGECIVCGSPLPIDTILAGGNVCDDCGAGYDEPDVRDIENDPDNGEQ